MVMSLPSTAWGQAGKAGNRQRQTPALPFYGRQGPESPYRNPVIDPLPVGMCGYQAGPRVPFHRRTVRDVLRGVQSTGVKFLDRLIG